MTGVHLHVGDFKDLQFSPIYMLICSDVEKIKIKEKSFALNFLIRKDFIHVHRQASFLPFLG